MTEAWVNQFYKKQNTWMKLEENLDSMSDYYQKEALSILQQLDGQAETFLELGAGMGELSRYLAVAHGKEVTTIELVKDLVDIAKSRTKENVRCLQGDFYTLLLEELFDVILYIDGFGIGSDQELENLLVRMNAWLTSEGMILLDVYEPNYWQSVAGLTMTMGENTRCYDYDKKTNRFIDTWWVTENPDEKVSQHLACYSLPEMARMLQRVGLKIVRNYPGGWYDYKEQKYIEQGQADFCISNRLLIQKLTKI